MTDFTATPATAQSRINSLLPGDTLTLQPGSYGALSVGVSGTANNNITIRGAAVDGTGAGTSIVGGTGVTITGQYLHIARILAKSGSTGFVVNGARNVMLESCHAMLLSGTGFIVRNNAKSIYLYNCQCGGFNIGETMTRGFVVGTTSGSWSGGVPDATQQIKLYRCYTQDLQGTSFQFFEGAHHIQVNDCYATYDGLSRVDYPSALYHGYDSSASDVYFERDFQMYAMGYAFLLQSKTVGGVKYGVRQYLWRTSVRAPRDGVWASNDATHLLWVPIVSTDTDPTLGYIDLAPTVTVWGNNRVNSDLVDYTRVAWDATASEYCLYPEGKNEFGLFKHFYGERPEVIYDVGHYNNVPSNENEATGAEFYHTEEDHQIRLVRIGYWQAWHTAYATFGAVFDLQDGTMVPNSFIALNPPITNYWGWVHTDLPIDAPAILWPNRHYRVVVWAPPAAVSIAKGGQMGWTMGLFPNEYYGWYDGADGINNKIMRNPTFSDAFVFRGQIPNILQPGTTYEWTFSHPLIWGGPSLPPVSPDPAVLPDGSGIVPTYANYGRFGFAGALNYLIDAVVGYWREPEDTTVPPGTGLQGALDNLIAGDVMTLSGVHLVPEALFLRGNGTAARPITIRGDGTAILRGSFGTDTCYDGLVIKGNYIKLENFIIEQFGRGLVIEGAKHVKIRQITARTIRGTAHSCQDGAQFIYYDTCVASDTGTDLNTGDGYRVGTTPSAWPYGDINVPEATSMIRYDNCQAYRTYGDGFDANSGANMVVMKGCSVNHSLGNIPPLNLVAGTSGFHSKADKIQFISCTVLGAPGAGYRCFDVLWSGVVFGRGQQVKAGSSTGHGQGGVVSQSDDMKVYSDFTATPAPRLVEVEGGWVAAGGNVNPTTFLEYQWVSPASLY